MRKGKVMKVTEETKIIERDFGIISMDESSEMEKMFCQRTIIRRNSMSKKKDGLPSDMGGR
jgi:hypothetical protein